MCCAVMRCGAANVRREAAMVAMTVRQWRDGRQSLPAHAANTVANIPCRSLPLLPPITRNVKLPLHATRLEFGGHADPAHVPKSKNGKNRSEERRVGKECR